MDALPCARRIARVETGISLPALELELPPMASRPRSEEGVPCLDMKSDDMEQKRMYDREDEQPAFKPVVPLTLPHTSRRHR